MNNTKQCLISSRFKLAHAYDRRKLLTSSQLSYVEATESHLQHGFYSLKSYDCPCGRGCEDILIAEIDRYGLPLNSVLCKQCGTVRIDPYLDDSSLESFYASTYQQMYGRVIDPDSYFNRQQTYGEKILYFSELFLNAESWICEVGCGAGGALSVFKEHGYSVAGCDYSSELLEEANKRGIHNTFYGSLENIDEYLSKVKFDLVYLHHVFEHLNDPVSFLQECKKHLSQAGRIILAIPDLSRIDACRFPAGDSLSYLHIAHKYNFSFEGLERLCSRVGLSVKSIQIPCNIQTPCSHSAELWVEVTPIEQDLEIFTKQSCSDRGVDVLRYLQWTEQAYSLGLCKGQLLLKSDRFLDTLNRLKKRVISFYSLSTQEKLRKLIDFLAKKFIRRDNLI